MNLLTIVTATKDGFEGLKKTIDSTKNYRNLGSSQVIVDGNREEDSSKIKEYANKEGVSYFWQKPQGIYGAFNFGLSKVESKWIWYLNGGDLALNGNESIVWSVLEKSNSDIVSFQIKTDDRLYERPPFAQMYPPVYNWIPHPGTIVKSDSLRKIGGFDEKFKVAGDGNVWFKMLNSNASMDIISIPVAHFTAGGRSSNLIKTKQEQKMVVKNNFLKTLGILMRRIYQMIYFLVVHE